jgi:hypothetical protein
MFGNITFLAPAALAGLALLALPVLVHIFKPRKLRQTPFSSLRWLRLTQQRLSRRIRWHQIFLFLLRFAFVLFLVLALARPMLSPKGEAGAAERFVVVDISRSMGYQTPDHPTPADVAKRLATELVAHQAAGDRTALLLTGSTTRVLAPLSRDAEAHMPELRAVQAGSSDTDLGTALSAIRPMLAHGRRDVLAELYFLTDNHQSSWSQGAIASFLKDLPTAVRARVIDVGVTAPQNAWVADARLFQASNPARLVVRALVGAVGDAAQERTVHLTGLAGVPDKSVPITVTPGRTAQVDFELPSGFEPNDKVAEIRLEPEDGLPSDDRYYLNLDTKASLRILLIEPDSTQVESLRPGFHLRTACEALAIASGHAIDLVTRTPANVSPEDFLSSDVILLADVPELLDVKLDALENRVKAGAGLAVFLGPGVKPSFWNTRVYKPLAPSDGLLSTPLKAVVEPQRHSLASMTNIRWQHPLLARLFDPILGDLSATRFRSFYQFGGPVPPSDTVLAWIDDNTPALVERSLGAGKVLLFNTGANDEWSDLPRRKSYVPLIDRVLTYLSGGGVRRSFEVGEPIVLPLREFNPGESITVRGPGGTTLTPALEDKNGRTDLRLDTVSQPGIYRVERAGNGKSFSFVVQVGRGDSVLSPMDSGALKKWWEPADFEMLTPEALTQSLGAPSDRSALWPWLVVLAGLALLAEMFFVHWLCPRVNPDVVSSVVTGGRRILAPAKAAES